MTNNFFVKNSKNPYLNNIPLNNDHLKEVSYYLFRIKTLIQ